jgi:hypothetical protein
MAQKAVKDAEVESRKRKMLLDEEEHAKKMKMREEELAIQKSQLEAKERELQIRDRDPEYKVNFYVSTFRSLGLELEGVDRILLKDMLRNAVAPIARNADSRVLLPVSDMYRKITGRPGNRQIWMAIGKYAAPIYRKMNGRDPEKTERVIDGASRMVAAYEGHDEEWMRPLIESYASGALANVKCGDVRYESGSIVF